MAKTKRRQLAALAVAAEAAQRAKAEGKELFGNNERTSSCDKSGTSGILPKGDEPIVEIRTQRVIFKIPALPPKPAADAQSVGTAKKQVLEEEVLKKPGGEKRQTNFDLSSEDIPADEAKIMKGLFPFGKWKRRKKIKDLLPSGEITVPSATGLFKGAQLLPVAKLIKTDKHQNGELPLSIAGSRRQAKKRVKLMTGLRKRAISKGAQPSPVAKPMKVDKHQSGELLISIAGSRRQSKNRVKLLLGPRKRAKLQELVVRAAAEKESEAIRAQNKPQGAMKSTLKKTVSCLVTSKKQRSRDLLLNGTDRSQELAKACNGDLSSTLAISLTTQKRRCRNNKKLISQGEDSPKLAVDFQHRTRSRSKISHCEALALEVLQEIHNEKIGTQHREHCGKLAALDTVLVRCAAAGEAAYTTGDSQFQTELQSSENFTSQSVQEKGQSTHVGVTVDIATNNFVQSGLPTSSHKGPQGDDPGDLKKLKLQIEVQHIPSPPEHGLSLIIQVGNSTCHSRENATPLRAAEMLKQAHQMRIVQKRLEAAGGLRNWLIDKGLGQLFPLLDEWKIDNYALVQLTMEGLKSMGLFPVGPRRKLIHAISSLSLPSFIKSPQKHRPY